MSVEELWEEALSKTEIVRMPMKKLLTFGTTSFEYIFLSPSEINKGDTVVRRGNLEVHKPTIILPNNSPVFEGFDSEEGQEILDETLETFFYLRGISFPSLKYKNEPYELDLFEGSVSQAVKHYEEAAKTNENVSTGILIGENSSWQFSVIFLACSVVEQHVEGDLRSILNKIKKK